jgi:sterol 3beta-glucosyltransferase
VNITLLTVGSRGDVQPFLALAAGMSEAGHDVTFATHREFEGAVEALGLRFSALEGDPRQILQSPEGLAWLEAGGNPLRGTRRLLDVARPLARQLMTDSELACRDAQAIIYSPLASPGFHLAEARAIPSFLAPLVPLARTRVFPEVGAPTWRLGGIYNLVTHVLGEQFGWQPFRKEINRWRKTSLGLRALPLRGPFSSDRWKRQPRLLGYSPTLAPRPRDWPSHVHVTGYWFLDRDDAWTPPPELVNFIDDGEAPVFVGFGSMPDRDPAGLNRIVREALQRVGRRGIVGRGWGGLSSETTEDVFVIDDVPHAWLFPRMAAIVHHGGAGTTHTAVRAGRPNVVVPFFTDQPFWGRRVAEAGVGPPPIRRRDLSANALARALESALSDDAMATRAELVASRIRSENGVEEAVAAFQRHLEDAPIEKRI